MRKTGFGGHWVFAANDHHACSLTTETDFGVLLKENHIATLAACDW
jgi:hypothetical protein